MSDGLTRTESALLEALRRERALLQERELVNSIIVHELANSVTALGAAVDLMGYVPQGSPAYTRALLDVRQGAGTLMQLLKGLGMLVDCTGRTPQVERIDITEFVTSLVTDPVLLNRSEQRRIRIETRSDPVPWFACPVLLRHALSNLLRNALRHGALREDVRIVLGGDSVRRWVHVINRGPCIPPHLRARLFEPGRKNARGGMGLGLYIARNAVSRNGGRIAVGSTRAATVFSIIIPGHTPAPPPPTAAREVSHTPRTG